MRRITRRAALLGPACLAAAGLGGCNTLDDLLGPSKEPLPGKREDVGLTERGLAVDAGDTATISVPPPAATPVWPQPGGGPAHAGGNIAVSGFTPAWRASVGEGGGYRSQLAAEPIVIPGRAVTMDSDGVVVAFDMADGRRQWRTETQAENDRSTNVGGGVSFADGMVYATTGRGEIMALDAGSGAIKWRKPLGAPARSAATVAEGRLVVITLDDRVQSFSAGNGERQWTYQASPARTTLFGQAAPAYANGLVVAGFGSGDLVALRAESGALAWTDSLASGRGSLVNLSGIRALPVIVSGRVFAIGGGGLLASLDLRSGRRLWEREVGGTQTPWLAGEWMFVQTQEQTLAAVGRDDGRVRWVTDMPRYDNPEKRRDPIFWTGPVLAGGKLILAGSNELAYLIDPRRGQVLGKVELRGAAAVAPVAAAGTLLILTDDGTLQAFR